MDEVEKKDEFVPCLRLYRKGDLDSGGRAHLAKAENWGRGKESIVN